MRHVLFALGAFAGFTAMAMSAITVHALSGLPPADLAMIHVALQVHGWHAFALLAAALWLPNGGRLTLAAGLCFAAGLLLFCGDVYGLALSWWSFSAAAPLGGTILMLGWLLLIGAALPTRSRL